MNIIEEATSMAWKNKSKIKEGMICSCYYCLSKYDGSEIAEYVDNEQTAVCPKCSIDSVIPEDVDEEILMEINKRWFSGRGK